MAVDLISLPFHYMYYSSLVYLLDPLFFFFKKWFSLFEVVVLLVKI